MQQRDAERSRAMLDILESISREGNQSQRTMASQFGVALGLVNTYLKICVKKGYVKVRRLPSRQYVYLLTPKGMAEKFRLTMFLLSNELERFRSARAAYAEVFSEAHDLHWRRVVLIGASDLAEISAICALEAGIEITALVDGRLPIGRFIGLPLVSSLTDVTGQFDGALITDVHDVRLAYDSAISELGPSRVLVPDFFGFPFPGRYAT